MGVKRSAQIASTKSFERNTAGYLYKAVQRENFNRNIEQVLVDFLDFQKPIKYLFPSTVWNEPNQLFTDSAVKNPEYGINLNAKKMKEFVENYAFEKVIQNV
jgi:hypothetical protein